MAFIICNMRKFKNADLKGQQIHNQREKESHTNPDIDRNRAHLNYDLLHDKRVDYKAMINEHIEKNVETKRAIRKDAVRCCSFMISASPEFFEKLSPESEREFFKSNLEFIQERYGKENVMYASVHKDETTPHMHVGLVPITKEKKLSAKQIFNKVEMKQLQEAIGKHNEKFGLQRGEPSDKKYLEIHKFKLEADKEELKAVSLKKIEMEQAVDQISSRLDDLKKTAFEAQAVDQIEVKEKGGLLTAKTVQMSKEDFAQVQSLAKAGEVFRKENKKLEKELADERSKTSELSKKNRILEARNKELELENRFLKRAINKFMDVFKEKKQEYMIIFGHLKARVLRQMNMKITDNHFENQNELKGAQHFLYEEKEREKTAPKKNRNQDHEMER
ncbi:MobV family relaxase [Bacillus paralicheniformis]|uniref:MobV family relaxase n=2 Tax=Bacillus paralicheniformis TaxID=1648923 RepID=UPI002DBB84C4|nr:MobV family relaxase [Bacillus paralicheniformis]MEC1028129.1 MobV family relaxase [Bacillus paralicheniformis]MEC1084421.1 MobV family relaxase [Bacillus paralicheniformis]MEC1110246.1 MobV family relaxase [Bacillus paralicheniformis]MEC1150210.1 MobV family relaxase [Bacillus paralicheniformis]MEC1170121.1 MobV family relaxase [Bacillus paralicheniformis]